MNRAHSNLLRAKDRTPGAYFEDLCFDAQQAAEKAIKAVFIKKAVDFPYTHDLGGLMSLLEQTGEDIPKSVRDATKLTRYELLTRYPGMAAPVREENYLEAVDIADAVVQWARSLIQAR